MIRINTVCERFSKKHVRRWLVVLGALLIVGCDVSHPVDAAETHDGDGSSKTLWETNHGQPQDEAIGENQEPGLEFGLNPEIEPNSPQDEAPQDDTPQDDAPDETPLNAASIVGSQFPGALECGESATASVEVLNTGSATWTQAGGYKLGTVGDEDPLHELHREYLPTDVEVPPNSSWEFEFELIAPGQPGTFTTDWQMVHEGFEWFGEIFATDIVVTCEAGSPGGWEFTDAMKNSVMQSATYVKDNYPQFFDLEDLPNDQKRTIAYEMMTIVINHLRNKGDNASRCIANPGLPTSDPFLWCSDALVLGPPGEAVTIDIYYSWSWPGTPQVAITATNATGVVTDDLVSLP